MSHHLASRRLRPLRVCALGLAVVFMAIGLRLFAQDRDVDPDIAPGARVARPRLPRPEMHVEPVDPEVEHLLFEWSEHTKRIKTLAGKHYRSTRDYQYGVESLAEGKFFVEMPDKGRIDVGKYTAESPKPGIVKTYPAPNGKNVKLTVKMDQKREKWICDGRVVRVVDDSRSTYEELPIPPSQQGANMIDGPLPFLLGMPPEKAKARYHFKILKDVNVGPGHVWIEVTPKSAMDAAEWVRAYVLLNLSTYLPDRVSLFNPAGTTETVYIFRDIETKRSLLQNVFGGDPFRPNLFGYKREVHAPPAGDPTKFVESPGRPMPHFIGDSSAEALRKTKQLKDERYRVEFKRGPRASSQEQEFHIEAQDPPPETPLRQGQTIVLRYYDKVRPGDQQQR
jgi:hypothetical protein